MNTMLKGKNGNNGNLISQIQKFANELKRSGKSPEQMLNDLVASGKYTNEQVEQAKKMAQMFIGKIK